MKGVEGIGTICRIESHWGEDVQGRPKPGAGQVMLWVAFDQQERTEWENSKSYTLEEFNQNLEYMLRSSNGRYYNEADLDSEIKKHEEAIGCSYGGNNVQRVLSLVKTYQRSFDTAMANSKKFHEEMRIYLQSLAIVADMVSRASTHQEKNARIRGLIEVIEGAIDKLVHIELGDFYSYNPYDSVFKSRYPVQRLVATNRELKTEVDRLKKLLEKNEVEVPEEMPF